MVLYLLNENTSWSYKIGHTKNKTSKRVKQLSTGNKNTIDIIWEFEHPEANKIEKMLHRHFEWCREEGEWFNFENVRIEDIKEKAIYFAEVLKYIK